MQEKHFCITLIGLSFLVHRVWGVGGVGRSTKFYTGRPRPEDQSLTLLYSIFRRFQSMTIDLNQYQSISINRLILIIDDQSLAKTRVVIDWHRISITIDR